MGLDGQCCIFGELIVCVRTVQVPTGYMYGNVSWAVPYTVQYSYASHGPTYGIVGSRLVLRIRTLVRVHLYRAVRTKVRSRLQLTCAKGGGNSTAVDSDVAVEEARRGSRIRLVLGGDLHRLAGLYGFAGAG